MTRAVPEMRREQIAPLSMPAELGIVALLCLAVVGGVWLYLWLSLGGGAATTRNLLPFQVLIQDRSTDEQRMFRELQEGILEAEARRSTAGGWPEVSALAAEGVPPFASDPTAKAAAYQWRLSRDGAYVNYLGIPDRSGVPAWLVLVQEPQLGVPDPAQADETHHRLIDGTMLQVSTWNHPNGTHVGKGLVRVPQAEGWTQFYAVQPSLLPR